MEELKYGWCGKILWVDLKNQTSREQDISDLCKEYIGCRGIAAKLCWDYLKPGTGAFDEENLLMYLAGPCAGTPVLAGGRSYFFGVGAQSYPEMYTRSSLGGRCGAAIKYCGYDGVILQNKADHPTVIEITEDGVTFHDGEKYRGRYCVDTQKMVKQDFGENAESCVIGPAGENKVRIAGIFCDRDNAAAQAGFGAVMGDKMVKAIVFNGHKGVRVADVKTIMELRDSCMKLKNIPKMKDSLPKYMGIGADGAGDTKYTNGRIQTQDVLDRGEALYITQKGNACVACGVPCHLAGYTFVRGSNGRYHRTADTTNSSKCTAKLMYGWMAGGPMELEWLQKELGRNYRWPMDFRTGAECCWMIDNYGLNSWEVVSLMMWLTELEAEGVNMDKLTGLHWDVDDPALIPHIAASSGISASSLSTYVQTIGEAGMILSPTSGPVIALLAITGLSYAEYFRWGAGPFVLVFVISIFCATLWINRKYGKADMYDREKYKISTEKPSRRDTISTVVFLIAFVTLVGSAILQNAGLDYIITVMFLLFVVVALVGGVGLNESGKIFLKGMQGGLSVFLLCVFYQFMSDLVTLGGGFESVAALCQGATAKGAAPMLLIATLVGTFAITGGAAAQIQIIHGMFWPMLQAAGVPMHLWVMGLICGHRATNNIYPCGNMIVPMGLFGTDNMRVQLLGCWLSAAAGILLSVIWCLVGPAFFM